MSLVRLPYELISYVIHDLSLADIRSLSLVCKRFQFLFNETSIARLILEKKAPAAPEAQNARVSQRYAVELRRLVKRREAVASISPFSVAIVGVAETWIFENGVLCYMHDRQLRILDIHRSASREIVVNIRALLNHALEAENLARKFKFQLVYCAHDIVSCVYAHAKPGHKNWLIVFNAKQNRILTVLELDSSHKIFVRNNDKYLFYGTFSEVASDGHKRWVIKGYDITAGAWMKDKVSLQDFAGSDIGSTICFEIIDEYFYGLSSLAASEIEERSWTSRYNCFRIPLEPRGLQKVEQIPRRRLWRRLHAEGPIDDRWTFLRIFKDETTAQLRVMESRKEWPTGCSSARRAYFIRELVFGPLEETDEKEAPPSPLDIPARNPHLVHPGDNGSTALMFTLSTCPIRSYHPACQTFIDLVDDRPSFNPSDQRIRLRGSSRRPWSPSEYGERDRLLLAEGQQRRDEFNQQVNSIYKHEEVVFWPPNEDPAQPDPALSHLYQILNPPGHLGNIQGSWNERSLVYATGGLERGLKALIFVSWDPSIHLMGTAPYPGGLPGLHISPFSSPRQSKGKGRAEDAWHPTVGSNATYCSDGDTGLGSKAASEPVGTAKLSQWVNVEQAMYRDIGLGYHFSP
ncbi:hypothetical protein B0T17DRAFT_485545 [Bombardia bombarda]|uniref:F-box domain-containing protein n=1 Tax=Bombardia bombarda TaxID=252184 RepID=A0AA40CEC4_9PEZI|nr:hypothetical protein B0T17DRAFT_485545 [Bombardia bombarda]